METTAALFSAEGRVLHHAGARRTSRGTGAARAALPAADYKRTAAGLLPLAVLGAAHLPRSRWAVAVVLVNFLLPYWHMYWSTFAPVRSVFSAPPGTWVMPFTMPPLDQTGSCPSQRWGRGRKGVGKSCPQRIEGV
ncbi:MAG: hypothetical protein ABSG50_00625 [Opitutaceae bacterium]|jgi:hypothetical protein